VRETLYYSSAVIPCLQTEFTAVLV
jgi:hypothetical protein